MVAYPDATPRAQQLMRRLTPWLQLLHFGPSVFTTLAFGVYIVLVARDRPPVGPLLLLLAAQLATQFAISLWNDYWDLPEDRIAKPDKPIPAGVISAARVRGLGWIAVVAAVALAAPLGPLVVACTVVGLGTGLSYDVRLKRTRWSPLPFALGFGVLPLWAAAGVGRTWDATVWTAAALTAWLVVALHLADTLPDLDADRAAGLRGLAHILGRRATLAVCWAALGSGLAAAVALGALMHADSAILAGTVVAGGGLLLAAILLYRQRGVPALRPMAGMIEAAALLTALGWLAAASF